MNARPASLLAKLQSRRTDLRVLWVLCLALLVPLAQGWSHWHAFSHLLPASSNNSTVLSAKSSSERDSSALHLAHCELCLAAAAIDAAAPPADTLHLAMPSLGEAQAASSAQQERCKQPLRAYQSRAPPTRFV